jgi:DNA-binding NtrC family response regulator
LEEKKKRKNKRGKGLVLVVDDEAIMRKIAVKVLDDAGFDVITAEDGEQGMELFREHHNKIQLVLLDMVLPKKLGRDVYLEMRDIKPDVNVLLNSGFEVDDAVEELLKLGVKHFIEKPYTFQALSSAIDKALDE